MQDGAQSQRGSQDLPGSPAHGTCVLPAKGRTRSIERPGVDVCPLSSFKVLLGGSGGDGEVVSSRSTTSGHILGTDKVNHGQSVYREAKQCGTSLSLLTWFTHHRCEHQRGPLASLFPCLFLPCWLCLDQFDLPVSESVQA